jgi:hypothetical protein
MKRFFALAAPLLALALAFAPTRAQAQSFPFKFDSAASTNATLVTAGYAQVRLIFVTNSTTALYYLKLYDTAATPVCNTGTVVFKAVVPFGSGPSGGGFMVPIPDGLAFQSGLGFCLTANAADNDNTIAATGVIINFGIKR